MVGNLDRSEIWSFSARFWTANISHSRLTVLNVWNIGGVRLTKVGIQVAVSLTF